MSGAESRALIGTSGWQKSAWRHGAFYPSGLAQAEELAFLADRVSTVEINSTFYGLKEPSSFLRWYDDVRKDFVLSVKAHRAITHDRALRGVEREIAAFLASGPLLLREKLGPFLWQLPPAHAFDAQLIEGFLAGLPRSVDEARRLIERHGGQVSGELAGISDRPLRHSMEVRHASFAQPRYLELLREHGVAAVVTNSVKWPVIDEVTADFVYLRIGDSLEEFPEGQSDEDLARYAARIRGWLDGGRDVFLYFDDPTEDHLSPNPPLDAIELQRRVGGESPAPGATLQASLW